MKFNSGILASILILSISQTIYVMDKASTDQEINDLAIALALQEQLAHKQPASSSTKPKHLTQAKKTTEQQLIDNDLAIAKALQKELNQEQPAKTSTKTTTTSPAKKSTDQQIVNDAKLAQQLQNQLNHGPHAQPAKKTPPAAKTNNPPKAGPAKPHAAGSAPCKDTIAIPKELIDKHIEQLKVPQQGPNECGSHAAINARAIQLLIQQQHPITSETVHQTSMLFKKFIRPEQLLYDEVRQVAQEIGLERSLVIAFNNGISKDKDDKQKIAREADGTQVSRFYVSSNTPDINPISDSLEQFFIKIIQHLDKVKANDFHLICNTGGHWISISIVRKGTTFAIYYCNSTNATLLSDSTAFKFIIFIQTILTQSI